MRKEVPRNELPVTALIQLHKKYNKPIKMLLNEITQDQMKTQMRASTLSIRVIFNICTK